MRAIDADKLKKSIDDCEICNVCPDKRIRCDYDDCDAPDYLTPKWEALIDAQPTIDIPTWIPCSERLPRACENVLLTCEVRPIGLKPYRYICIAQWIPKFCKEALDINWDEENTEYCEEDDEYYPFEGWYESISNWDDYGLVGVADFAIAWMPRPQPCKEKSDE